MAATNMSEQLRIAEARLETALAQNAELQRILREDDLVPRNDLVRRCPKCGKLTAAYEHCFVKGPPLIPQLDDYTSTEPITVLVPRGDE